MSGKNLLVVLLFSLAGSVLALDATACGKGSKSKPNKHSEKLHRVEHSQSPQKEKACGSLADSGNSDHHKGSKPGHRCPSDCNHSNCKCLNFCVTIALQAETSGQFYSQSREVEKAFKNVVQVHPSPGFHTVWLIPKIS